jgi:hypothetical protein
MTEAHRPRTMLDELAEFEAAMRDLDRRERAGEPIPYAVVYGPMKDDRPPWRNPVLCREISVGDRVVMFRGTKDECLKFLGY